jgi:hypothetical protein
MFVFFTTADRFVLSVLNRFVEQMKIDEVIKDCFALLRSVRGDESSTTYD